MSEPGGSTTYLGIWYQNSITALYLGRMCDATMRPDSEQVVEVRVNCRQTVVKKGWASSAPLLILLRFTCKSKEK